MRQGPEHYGETYAIEIQQVIDEPQKNGNTTKWFVMKFSREKTDNGTSTNYTPYSHTTPTCYTRQGVYDSVAKLIDWFTSVSARWRLYERVVTD